MIIGFAEEIEQLRCKMIKTGCELGLNNKKTLEYSKQLDLLINKVLEFDLKKVDGRKLDF